MRRMVVCAVGGVAIALLAGAIPALGAEGRIPIWQPVTISQDGRYIVTRNITNPVGSVIRVSGQALNVDIDLNGMTLRGGGLLPVIDASGVATFAVRDGTLFGDGGDGVSVVGLAASGIVVEDLAIHPGIATGIRVYNSAPEYQPLKFVIRRNIIIGPSQAGIEVSGGFP